MKLKRTDRELQRGFSLTEVMVASTLSVMIVTGVIYSHFVGAKMYQLTQSKLGASDQARGALSLLTTEIRSAKRTIIGNGSQESFTPIADGSSQKGSSMQIYPTTNDTAYIRYYLDASDSKLKRTSSSLTTPQIIAEHITNNVVFSSEDHLGNVLTESQNNRVIGLTLQFYQIQYPITSIGQGQFYDFYQMRTKITRRTLE